MHSSRRVATLLGAVVVIASGVPAQAQAFPELTEFRWIKETLEAGDSFDFNCDYDLNLGPLAVFGASQVEGSNGLWTVSISGYSNFENYYARLTVNGTTLNQDLYYNDVEEAPRFHQPLMSGTASGSETIRVAWASWGYGQDCQVLINGEEVVTQAGPETDAVWLPSWKFSRGVDLSATYLSTAALQSYSREVDGFLFFKMPVGRGTISVDGPDNQHFRAIGNVLPICFQPPLPCSLFSWGISFAGLSNGNWRFNLDATAGAQPSPPGLWLMQLPP